MQEIQELISIKPMQEHFASGKKIIDQKYFFAPNLSPKYWDNKYPFFIPLIFYPPPPPTSKFFNPPYKVDGGLIEVLQFYVQNKL